MKRRFIFLNSHPIQYFTPMYAQMAKNEAFDVTVLYCSRQSVEKRLDRQFSVDVSWDIPLLEGYRSHFLRNYARKPSLYSFWGLQNWGVVAHLWRAPKSVVVINGWQFFIYVVAIVAGKLFGHTICLRGESPLEPELKKSRAVLALRKLVLGKMLFRLVDHFCYIGSRNKAFYRFYGVAESKLVFTPYAVDNLRFRRFLPKSDADKAAIRRDLNLPEKDVVVLFSGKFIDKKRPLDLLQAFLALDRRDCTLVFLGEGALRPQMEAAIREAGADKVVLTGFINQADIPRYYAAADIFAMCSDEGETWGLSVNEAMNLALPLVLSDAVGCAPDLVESGVNGYSYPVGDTDALRDCLEKLLSDARLRRVFGKKSLAIVDRYDYRHIIRNFESLPFLEKYPVYRLHGGWPDQP